MVGKELALRYGGNSSLGGHLLGGLSTIGLSTIYSTIGGKHWGGVEASFGGEWVGCN